MLVPSPGQPSLMFDNLIKREPLITLLIRVEFFIWSHFTSYRQHDNSGENMKYGVRSPGHSDPRRIPGKWVGSFVASVYNV